MLWKAILIIMLTLNGTKSQSRLDELVYVCNGQDLLHVITRACSIFKRSISMPQDIPAIPRSIQIQDVGKVCCKLPCRMALFVRLCS